MATFGASAPASHTVNYDSLLTTTLSAYRPTLVDNIFKDSVILAALREFGGIEYVDGGDRIQIPLMYEAHTHVGSYRGYETIDIVPQDPFTSAFFRWAEVATTVTISRLEERQNSGEAALLNLLKSKIQHAEMSLREEINSQIVLGTVASTCFVSGNSGKDLYPLGYFMPKAPGTDPAGTGNDDIGNISSASYSWWRARNGDLSSNNAGVDFSLNVSTYKGFIVGLKRLYNYCSRGSGGSPNLVVMNQGTFETYESAVDERSRIQTTKLGEIGFDSLKLRGAECVWDEKVPDIHSGTSAITYGTAFMLNTNAYKLVIDKQTDFVNTPFVEPENQTAKTAKILFMGQTTANNLRKLGVGYCISQSIVA